ncbi:hypothetical protein BLNAU_12424 [Blattamonas nauphoetae]|uniref:Uncharacterized protein n=1 Tax=Blattamonas nauphoetae TaxID=2049346 RepID=A0ABQ9XJJ3_9EUKA|nr:hypothetical protein BLNAU_12424 [Blattamonas nauphoetae]
MTKEQELLRNTFALFKEDSIPSLLNYLRGSERIVSDENVGWFEDGFSEPFRWYFIPNRVHLQKCVMDSLLIIVQSKLSEKCENMLIKVLYRMIVARSHNIIPPELAPSFSEFVYQFISSPVGLRLMRRSQQEYNLKWFLMEFLVDSCQPSRIPSEHAQIVLTRPTPLLISAIDVINTRFSIHNLSQSLSTPPDLTNEKDEDSSARTDLAFDVLFLSLLSIVSDEEVHKPARHLLARMFEMSEGELERLLLEREVRRGDLEMEWLGEGRTKEDTLSFAEGVWMLLGRRETEEERDEDTEKTDTNEENDENMNEADTDEESERETESDEELETKSETEPETKSETESVEYPRKVWNNPLNENTSTPTVFLHRVACLLISTLFSAASLCLPSNHQPTASTDTTHHDHDSTDDTLIESNTHQMSESHLFRICLKLTFWLQTTFEKWKSGSVFTKTVRMDVESAVSLVFLLLPHADLDSQCFLVSLLHNFSRFIEMVPRVITPDLVRKVALFFARLTPSLPHKLVLSVEYGVMKMLEGRWHSQCGPEGEEAAELCKPILGDLLNRLESDVERRREIAAQIWVIVSSNDDHLLYEIRPLVPLLSVLSYTTDVDEAFFILRACTKTIAKAKPLSDVLFSMLLQHSSTILRFGKQMDRPQVVTEAWRLLFQLLVESKEWFRFPRDGMAEFLEISERLVMEFVETVKRALQMRGQTDQTVGREADFNDMLNVLGSFFVHFDCLFDIDFSPLILSLIPAVTSTRRFFYWNEHSLWNRIYHDNQTIRSSFQPPTPFRFIATSSSFPTEQSVYDNILNDKLADSESLLRFGKSSESDVFGKNSVRLKLFNSAHHTLRVRMALECAIRLPRLLFNLIPFFRAKQAQFEQGEDRDWLNEMHKRVGKVFSTVNPDLLSTHPGLIATNDRDNGLIVWALTNGNRRDAVPPTNEDDSSPSESTLSFFENLQFSAMWMLNGMVECPFSFRTKRYDYGIPLLWRMLLSSILFHPPFDPSIAQTAVQLRVCLWEEGIEDVVGAVECWSEQLRAMRLFWCVRGNPILDSLVDTCAPITNSQKVSKKMRTFSQNTCESVLKWLSDSSAHPRNKVNSFQWFHVPSLLANPLQPQQNEQQPPTEQNNQPLSSLLQLILSILDECFDSRTPIPNKPLLHSSLSQLAQSPSLDPKIKRKTDQCLISLETNEEGALILQEKTTIEDMKAEIARLQPIVASDVIFVFNPDLIRVNRSTVTRINGTGWVGCYTKAVSKGIHRLSIITFAEHAMNGVMDAAEYPKFLSSGAYTSPKAAMMYNNDGKLYRLGKPFVQNTTPQKEQEFSVEADLENRTLHFFINGMQQLHHFIDIPVPLVFAIDVYNQNDPTEITFWGEIQESHAKSQGTGHNLG